MLLRVPETSLDQGSALSPCSFGFRRTHPRLVCLYELFAFQPLDRSTFLGIADTTVAKRTGSAVFRGAVEPVLNHNVFVAPSFLLSTPVVQPVPHGAGIRLLLGEPLELVLAYACVCRLCSILFCEVFFLHQSVPYDSTLLSFLHV